MHDWAKLPFFEHRNNFADKHFINISHTHRLHASFCFFFNTNHITKTSYVILPLFLGLTDLPFCSDRDKPTHLLKIEICNGVFTNIFKKIGLGSSSCLRTSHSSSAAAHQPFILFPHATTPCSKLFHS